MRIYAGMDQRMPLSEVGPYARRVEALGYDGLNVPDAVHDGLLAAHAALCATSRLRVATSVLVCFPRSPMITAHAAWDLQAASGGRFELGLGTQVRGNIVGRYSTPWAAPVARMREYVGALRAIWDCFQNGGSLAFEGKHYRFTRMQPFFNPGPIEHPATPIYLGAVGPRMTSLAGEVADGLMTHPTHSAPRYLREVTHAEISAAAEKAGRSDDPPIVMAAGFVATGATTASVERAREQIRELLGFLYSTPAYWRCLDVFGWGEVGRTLHEHSLAGRWPEMSKALSDDMLDTLVPQGTYAEIAPILHRWYGGLADCITFPVPEAEEDDELARAVIEALRAGGTNA
jgi:probable F420-dependent oxidoreductase